VVLVRMLDTVVAVENAKRTRCVKKYKRSALIVVLVSFCVAPDALP
jgi:hypothetical protein